MASICPCRTGRSPVQSIYPIIRPHDYTLRRRTALPPLLPSLPVARGSSFRLSLSLSPAALPGLAAAVTRRLTFPAGRNSARHHGRAQASHGTGTAGRAKAARRNAAAAVAKRCWQHGGRRRHRVAHVGLIQCRRWPINLGREQSGVWIGCCLGPWIGCLCPVPETRVRFPGGPMNKSARLPIYKPSEQGESSKWHLGPYRIWCLIHNQPTYI